MKTALRNLGRNRRRTALSALAVFVPVFVLVVSLGMIGGMEVSLFRNLTGYETGHLQIRRRVAGPEGGALPLIRDPAPLVAAAERAPDLAQRMVRLEVPSLASSGDRSVGVLVQGVRPEEAADSPFARGLVQGRFLHAGESGAVVGAALLDELDLSVGDELVLLGAHPEAGMGVALPTIVGAYRAPDPALERTLVQVDLAVAQRLVRSGAITTLVAYVAGVTGPWDGDKIEQVAAALRAQVPEGLEVRTWSELVPESEVIMRFMRPVTIAFMAAFFLLGGLIVLNTLYLSVLERTTELGIILALGAPRRWVMGQVLTEAGVLASASAILGALAGAGAVLLVEAVGGLPLPGAYGEAMGAWGLDPVLRMRLTLWDGILSPLAMVAVAVLAAWYPARRAAGLEPMETMRHAH